MGGVIHVEVVGVGMVRGGVIWVEVIGVGMVGVGSSAWRWWGWQPCCHR